VRLRKLIEVKIGLVILHADPARGGAERYTADLAAALADRGHAVSVLASTFAEHTTAAPAVLLDAGGATRAGRYARFLESMDSHLDREPYDVVHAMLPVRRCDVYHPHAGIALEAVRSGHLKHEAALGRAVARIGNRINLRRQRFAKIERELLQSPSPPTVLCLSEYVTSAVRKHYDIPEGKLATLFNAVDLARFDPAIRPEGGVEVRRRFAIPADRVVGLMIAQDFERKGLREVIAALSAARDRQLTILVAGKQDPAPYRKLADANGVGDRVIFAGLATDPHAFYRAADFLVLPTRHDPCSLVVLEALAMGIPVISTIFNGACEIMHDGVHGFVLPDPADVQALARAMTYMTDTERRRQMSRACLALRPDLSYDRHIDRLLTIYADVPCNSSSNRATLDK
jgi:UDP-glucose:(heptosyl)LPS alpha-1,3-glucosyltransferase